MKLKIILPIAAVVLLLVGVVLMGLTLASPNSSFIKDVTLNDSGTTQETLEMSANGLTPGDVREYTLNFKSQSSGSYMLNFQFVELSDGALKDFVKVTLLCDDSSATYNLSDLLGGEVATLKVKVVSKQNCVVKVIYEIPIEVGNEAQNATADFTVNLTAEKI